MNKILVTFATRTGSTIGVAQAVADVLKLGDARVDVVPVRHTHEISHYNAVIIGSSIRMGRWLPEAVEFCAEHAAELNKIPTAIFTVHLLNRDNSEMSRKARQAYTAPVREILTPTAEVFFNGKMDYTKLNFLERVMAKSMATSYNTPQGDYRDWEAIRRWAKEIEPTFAHMQ